MPQKRAVIVSAAYFLSVAVYIINQFVNLNC